MAIDFSSIGATPAPTEVAPAPAGVSVNLAKNTVLNLTKSNPSLRRVKLAAGWDIAQVGSDFDLDISVFLLDNNKIKSVQDVVYYNNLQGPGVKLDGDNQTGAGDGDDESLHIDFSQIPSNYNKIITTVTIYDAQNRRQTFGQVNNSYVRLVDEDTNNEICRFDLKNDVSTAYGVMFAELLKDDQDGTWSFHTIGDGYQSDLNGLLALFS